MRTEDIVKSETFILRGLGKDFDEIVSGNEKYVYFEILDDNKNRVAYISSLKLRGGFVFDMILFRGKYCPRFFSRRSKYVVYNKMTEEFTDVMEEEK